MCIKTCCSPNIHVQWQLVSTGQTTQSDTGVQCGLSFHFEKGNLCVANIVSEASVDPLPTEKVASVCVGVCMRACECVWKMKNQKWFTDH